MKLLKIITYPDPRLKRKCCLVDLDKNLPDIQKLANKMFDTIKFFQVHSISSVQVGVGFRMFVVDYEGTKTTFINPELINFFDEVECEERCLSFPKLCGYSKRFNKIQIKYFDFEGKELFLEAENELAHIIQHNMDHLNGFLFVDKLSRIKKEMILKRLRKIGKIKS